MSDLELTLRVLRSGYYESMLVLEAARAIFLGSIAGTFAFALGLVVLLIGCWALFT
jgi:hypothetical protein